MPCGKTHVVRDQGQAHTDNGAFPAGDQDTAGAWLGKSNAHGLLVTWIGPASYDGYKVDENTCNFLCFETVVFDSSGEIRQSALPSLKGL